MLKNRIYKFFSTIFISLGLIVLLGVFFYFVYTKLIPGWQKPINKSFNSFFGYAKVARMRGDSFTLTSERVQMQDFNTRYLGEGRLQSDYIQIPILPMALITEVRVKTGQTVTKDELLLRLDTKQINIRLQAAQAKVDRAKAELERYLAGSHQTQAYERPGVRKGNLEYRKNRREFADKLLQIYQPLQKKGVVSEIELLKKQDEFTRYSNEEKIAALELQIAEQGRKHSEIAAEKILDLANATLEELKLEIRKYEVRSPVDGTILEVLVLANEFNRNPGKPALIISSGLWFEARLGQSAFSKIAVGMPCEVYLEAYPSQSLPGTLTLIKPFIDSNLAGPEIKRPIRPRGTGAPEWPSIFQIQVTLENIKSPPMIPGMTGFVAINVTRKGLGVPDAAVDNVFALDRSRVLVVESKTSEGKAHWKPRSVTLGLKDNGWTEVIEGLKQGDEVLLGGFFLQPSDPVKIVNNANQEEKVSEKVAEKILEKVSRKSSEKISKKIAGKVSKKASRKSSKKVSRKSSKKVSRKVSKKVAGKVSQKRTAGKKIEVVQ